MEDVKKEAVIEQQAEEKKLTPAKTASKVKEAVQEDKADFLKAFEKDVEDIKLHNKMIANNNIEVVLTIAKGSPTETKVNLQNIANLIKKQVG